ncbi:MAG: helix-turn-helix domain-containing protein [Stellaceae bacterium]
MDDSARRRAADIAQSLRLEFGRALRIARKQAGLSQTQLAEHLGCSQQHLSRVERGAHTVNLPTMIRFADAVGLNLRIVYEPRWSRYDR